MIEEKCDNHSEMIKVTVIYAACSYIITYIGRNFFIAVVCHMSVAKGIDK